MFQEAYLHAQLVRLAVLLDPHAASGRALSAEARSAGAALVSLGLQRGAGSPAQVARALTRLEQALGHTRGELGQQVGAIRRTVERMLRRADAPARPRTRWAHAS